MNPEAMTYADADVTLQERLAEVDGVINDLQEQIAFGEAIARLEANPDFQKVISIGYLEAEATRITGLIVGDDPLRRESMENIIEAGLSIRNFKQFIKYKKLDASQAPVQIEEAISFRKQVTAEYAEDDQFIEAEMV